MIPGSTVKLAQAEANPGKPFTGVGVALKKLLSDGTNKSDITTVVRGMQTDLLFSLCSLLDDPGDSGRRSSKLFMGSVSVERKWGRRYTNSGSS